jgi:DNA-binding NtrC family response regulator
MQAKLLRVLQEGEVTPVGDHRARQVDVRVIAATNRDLAEEIRSGNFREDLYYRLAAFPIQIPPLQERREDIPLLVERFVVAAAKRHDKRVPGIEPEALERLSAYAWPGNVRELQNEIERAVALSGEGEPVRLDVLSPKLSGAMASGPTAVASVRDPALPWREARLEWEMAYLREVLRQQDGNVSRTARVLGLSRVMLQRKMKEYGLRA